MSFYMYCIFNLLKKQCRIFAYVFVLLKESIFTVALNAVAACGWYVCILSGNDVPSIGTGVYLQPSMASASLMTSGQSVVSHEAGSTTFSVAEGRVVVPSGSNVSPKSTGATVHHHGPTDLRESPFAHLHSPLQDPGRPAVSIVPERRLSSESSADIDVQACKRIKLEPAYDVSSLSSSPLFYRTLYVNSREHELLELRSSCQDHIMELFFLENSGNLMDYIAWSKRPNIHLSCLLQSASLDNTDETKVEDEVCHLCYVICNLFHPVGGPCVLNSLICLSHDYPCFKSESH